MTVQSLMTLMLFVAVSATVEGADSSVSALLRKLDEGGPRFSPGEEDWARTIRELIELGPDAVPELCAALDATPIESRPKLRAIPFVLRGIGDKRAIPALIRAIPKCCGADGSDMGYRCKDPELLAFMQKHDKNSGPREAYYSYGRPVNEVFATLHLLTGVEHGDDELCFVDARNSTPAQLLAKQRLFFACAERWQEWWEEHWKESIDNPAYSRVNLPDGPPSANFPQLDRQAQLTQVSGASNLIASSIADENSKRVFYDLDTGRWGALPKHIRGDMSDKRIEKIRAWAAGEGYDLMGAELEANDQSYLVIRKIGMDVWEIPMSIWENFESASAQELIDQGLPAGSVLAHYDPERQTRDYDAVGAFFYITREGTSGMLVLGAQVREKSPGRGVIPGNVELESSGPYIGRRFGLRRLEAK